jgi:hypothetical protein
MVIADMTATGDDNVLTSKSNEMQYRKEQLQRLQEEVISLEELKTGVNITDLGLNDFRMDLVTYMQNHQGLEKLPHGMHAVVPANIDIGLKPGVIFALRNRNSDVNINQQNQLHPYYLEYMDLEGNVIHDHTEVKSMLDLIRTGCKGISKPVAQICRAFNSETDDGRDMSRYSEILNSTISSIIEIKEEQDLDSLFSSKSTTALENKISGLDDFELIAFLVIVPQENEPNNAI